MLTPDELILLDHAIASAESRKREGILSQEKCRRGQARLEYCDLCPLPRAEVDVTEEQRAQQRKQARRRAAVEEPPEEDYVTQQQLMIYIFMAVVLTAVFVVLLTRDAVQ